MPIAADDVMSAVRRTADHLPDLEVRISPHCEDATWAADVDTCTVYVAGHLDCGGWSSALLDALDALCHHHQVPAPRGLRLVHSQPARERPETSTG